MFHSSFNKARRTVRFNLVITFPDGAVHSFPVGDAAVTIGRSPATAIRVAEEGVSRQHCIISPAGGRLIVLDQGSTNGTFVNGALVKQARLNDGDVVQVGSTRIRVQVTDESDEEPVLRPAPPASDDEGDEVDTLTFELAGQTQALHRLLERLASSDGAVSAAELVLDAIFEVFPVDRVFILTRRRDKSGSVPEVLASRTRSSPKEISGDLDHEVARRVFNVLCNDPNMVNASDATAAVRVALADRSVSPVMCAPMRHGGEIFGAIYLDALTLPVWAQSQEMLNLLSSVGALTALALTRARLQAELTLEQRLSQLRAGRPATPKPDADHGERPSSGPEPSEAPSPRARAFDTLRQHRRLVARISGRLLVDVKAQFSAIDERLSLAARGLEDGSDEAAAVLEALTLARRVVTSVEDAASLAELEATETIERAEPVTVAELIEAAADRFQDAAEEQGVTLLRGPVEAEPVVAADRQLLGRAIDLLVLDALRHVERGGRVVISARVSAANCEIVIADTGPGVPRELRDAIFSGDGPTPEGRGSTGIGLFFCRAVAAAHGGTIRVSGPTGNNRMILSLPVK